MTPPPPSTPTSGRSRLPGVQALRSSLGARLVGLAGRAQELLDAPPAGEVPEWATPPVRRPARPEVRAAVLVSDRLAAGLALEWDQRPVPLQEVTVAVARDADAADDPGADVGQGEVELRTELLADLADVPSDVDLLLVELCGSWAGATERPAYVGTEALRVPLVLWVTGGAPADDVTALLARAVAVHVADAALLETWAPAVAAAGGPEPTLLAPAASTRVTPVGPDDRAGVVAVLDSAFPPALAGEVATVAMRGVRGADLVPFAVHRLGTTPVPKQVEELAAATPGSGSWTDARAALGRAAVAVDLVRRSPADTWDVLEAAATQTAVVSVAGWDVPTGLVHGRGSTAAEYRGAVVARLHQAELRDREARRLHRGLVAAHGLTDRVDTLLAGVAAGLDPADAAGVTGARLTAGPVPVGQRTVSAVVPTNRTHELDNVFANLARQSHRQVELVLVLHGLEVDLADLRARAADAGVPELVVVEAPSYLTLGACMNAGIDAASGAYVAKMDDDNYYGTHYLTDLLASFDTSGAGVVGKWAHYVWMQSDDAVVLRYPDAENAYARRIQGGSMVFDGDLVRSLRFSDIPRAVDSDILDRAMADGVRIWSADRYNYVSIRGVDRTAHTWTVTDETFLTASGRLAFHGDPRTHVEV